MSVLSRLAGALLAVSGAMVLGACAMGGLRGDTMSVRGNDPGNYAGGPSQPQPAYAAPSYREPNYRQRGHAEPQTVHLQPAYNQPSYAQPTTVQPNQQVYGGTPYAAPGYGAPAAAPQYYTAPRGADPNRNPNPNHTPYVAPNAGQTGSYGQPPASGPAYRQPIYRAPSYSGSARQQAATTDARGNVQYHGAAAPIPRYGAGPPTAHSAAPTETARRTVAPGAPVATAPARNAATTVTSARAARQSTPASQPPHYERSGWARWMGQSWKGRKTESGEIFDPVRLTAAHHNLPLPSFVYVTNRANGRTVLLRVNDRVPAKPGRAIIVSQLAAELLGFRGDGRAKVDLQYAGPASPVPNMKHEEAFLLKQTWFDRDMIRVATATPPAATAGSAPVNGSARYPAPTYPRWDGSRRQR